MTKKTLCIPEENRSHHDPGDNGRQSTEDSSSDNTQTGR